MKFEEFELSPELLTAIQKAGYSDATPIQDAVIPSVLKGKDVSGLAQTGTGKTAAFVIPLIDRIIRHKAGETGERVPANWKKNSFVLVLVPTRELAVQVEAAISQFGKTSGMRSVVVVGGEAYDEQKRALREGVEFIVGTPGRLLDLYKSHSLDLNGVGAIVFDEADRMFDMGFKDDMKFILKRVPRDRQFLLFSATLNFDVLNTSYEFGAEPIEFNVSRDQVTAEGIDHEILHVGQLEKPMYLYSLLTKMSAQQCIVFSNFKYNVSRIARFLKNNGIEAIEMSSLLSQTQRNKVLEAFRTGKKQILVATDVAARGLDIKGVDLVINFDLPDEAQGYVHRIGRTGRAGTSGKAIGLVSDRDVDALTRIEEYLKEKIKIGWLDETDLIKEFKPFPSQDDEERSAHVKRQRRAGSAPAGRPQSANNRGGPRSGPRRPPAPRTQQDGHRTGNRPQAPNTAENLARPQPTRGPHPTSHSTPHRAPHSSPHSAPRRPNPRHETNKPETQGAHGQTAEARGNAPLGQHRDRVLGRHGGNPAVDKNSSTQNRNIQNRHQGSKSATPKVLPPRRQLKKTTNRIHSKGAEKTAPGIAEKVKGFFSKLFK